jgi:hypothetical protein
MPQLNLKALSKIIQEKVDAYKKIEQLREKTRLLESEIRNIAGNDFDAEEFFSAAGFAAQDDIEKEYGKNDWASLGSTEDIESFINGLIDSSDDEAQRLAPDYFNEEEGYEDI